MEYAFWRFRSPDAAPDGADPGAPERGDGADGGLGTQKGAQAICAAAYPRFFLNPGPLRPGGPLGPALALPLLCGLLWGCSHSRLCHRSPLLSMRLARGSTEKSAEALRGHAPRFEDAIVLMVEDFGVPLEEVAPVQVYYQEEEGRSYYNRLTRAIVLRGPVDPAAFVHELSHLLAHRVHRSPPYWSDQALAEHMESRHARPSPSSPLRPPPARLPLTGRSLELVRRIASERNPAEVLAHLERSAVDEERGWGVMVVRYLFEDRWASLPMPDRIRLLLNLEEEEVEALAPELIEFCRRREIRSSAGPAPAGG